MAEMKKFIYARGSLRAKLTNFENYLEKLTSLDQLDEQQVFNLRDRLENVSGLLGQFEKIQQDLDLCAETPGENCYDALTEFEDKFFSAVSLGRKIYKQNECKSSYGTEDTAHFCPAVVEPREPKVQVKLPQIPLPIFDGQTKNWLKFRDTFDSLINLNNQLSNIQKLHYLRLSLTSIANEIVQALELTNDNYPIAWKLLCDRYNNKPLLVHNHMKALFDTTLVHPPTAESLRCLSDNIHKHIRALSSLNLPTDKWDTILIFFLLPKLDIVLRRRWEERQNINDLPTLQEFTQFLNYQANMQETIESTFPKQEIATSKNISRPYPSKDGGTVSSIQPTCVICKGKHYLNQCEQFLAMNSLSRYHEIKQHKLCVNCFSSNHATAMCRSGLCRQCNKKHHTLLHVDRPSTMQPNSDTGYSKPSYALPITTNNSNNDDNLQMSKQEDQEMSSLTINDSLVNLTSVSNASQLILLSTAKVVVSDGDNKLVTLRCLLDSGSQSNFISEAAFKALDLPSFQSNRAVVGISGQQLKVKSKARLSLSSLYNQRFMVDIDCLIAPKLCADQPSQFIDIEKLPIPINLQLADDKFYEPGPIDIILGAELFYYLLCAEQKSLGQGLPILQNTHLGWIISGPIPYKGEIIKTNCNLINELLPRFWELEECLQTKEPLDNDNQNCEELFLKTTTKAHDGKFIVTMPMKESPTTLGDTRNVALKRFQTLERKLQANFQLRTMYTEFMKEYKNLGHMTKLIDQNEYVGPVNYLPHHGILNAAKETTKLRVVFDGSCKSSSGTSLNDIQYTGKIHQQDIFSILLRFRKHTYVVNADIEKMYRMMYIEPDQRHLQRILWRDTPNEEISTYILNTVTYGTASAPFLATRCLKKIGDDVKAENPHSEFMNTVADAIINDFYMDDLLTGSENIKDIIRIIEEIDRILKKSSFVLRKWKSNNKKVLSALMEMNALNDNKLHFSNDQYGKILGLTWFCQDDNLCYSFDISDFKPTKRELLSNISKIFDPLGLLGPIIVVPKMMLQSLWKLKIDWDKHLPEDIVSRWLIFSNQLFQMKELSIPRHVACPKPKEIQFHGFCDSSMKAYGACIYVRTISHDDKAKIELLCSKSRVAPLKTQTLPRLELCAALLLAILVEKVHASWNMAQCKTFYWSDSNVALCWIKGTRKLQLFVKNRVNQIRSLTNVEDWRWVPTASNPADLLTRGIEPCKLKESKLWWFGPEWLKNSAEGWPQSTTKIKDNEIPELLTECNLHTNQQSLFEFERWSTFTKAIRIVAFSLRFIYNIKNKERIQGTFRCSELEVALNTIIRQIQMKYFYTEYMLLTDSKPVSRQSSVLSLNPFIDQIGILRVGGRLCNNKKLSFDKRHPILLPYHDHVVKLLFRHEHIRLLHAGPTLLLAHIRDKYWPLRGYQQAKKIVHECVRCFRAKPSLLSNIMGNLPAPRITVSLPFTHVGVDYAGPFLVRDRKGRGAKITKCYICIFICFSSKAIHIELVSDLSTQRFLLAFRRFMSRRGKPEYMYSDNGSTFVRANKDIKELFSLLQSNAELFSDTFASEGVRWSFIPIYSPHMGGLWESAVRSCKFHLKRILGQALLIFEEFYTVLTEIEAILNSRPLTKISTTAGELEVLTPAHFLVGRKLSSLPQEDLTSKPDNRLINFQNLEKLKQQFWNRWTREYLAELQHRSKWRMQAEKKFEVGTVVIINEENKPSMCWPLGIIIQMYPGEDNITRVVDVRLGNGKIVRRSIAKLGILPTET